MDYPYRPYGSASSRTLTQTAHNDAYGGKHQPVTSPYPDQSALVAMLDPAYHMTQLVRARPFMTQVDEEICTGRVMTREKALEDLQVSTREETREETLPGMEFAIGAVSDPLLEGLLLVNHAGISG
ncbi:hypothetical protein FOXYSP1_03576 [Fusarium oxysporum f. sp. phaseoli]